jgi:hypothetical protein
MAGLIPIALIVLNDGPRPVNLRPKETALGARAWAIGS